MTTNNTELPRLAAGVAALAAGCLLFLFAATPAEAATKTWDGGGGDTLWSNPLNWNNDSLPQSSDSVRLDAPVTIRLDIDHEIADGGEIRTTSGFGFGVFIVESGITLTGRSLDLEFGFFQNDGTIASPGAALLTGFEIGTFFTNTGTLARAFMTVGPNATFDNRFGTVSDSTIRLSTGSSLVNLGTLDDVSVTTGLGSGATITNDGSIPNLGSLFLGNANDLFDNNGTIVNRGEIKNRGTIDNSGTLDNRGRIFNECVTTTSNATPAVFINTGDLLGRAPETTCRVWDNDSGNRLWSNPVNWSGDVVPTRDDLVVIADVSGTASAPILDTDFEIRNELIIHAFSILSVGPSQTLLNNGLLTVRGGALLVDGAFRNQDEMVYSGSGGGTGNLSVFGNFVNAGDGEFRNSSRFFNGGSSVNNGGNEILFADGAAFNNTTTFTNSGRVVVSCGVDFRDTGTLPGNRFVGLCKRWDGGGGADRRWSNPLNWHDNSPPQGNDSILLDYPGAVRLDQSYAMGLEGSLATGPDFLFGIFSIDSGVVLEARSMNLDFGFIDNEGTITSPGSALLVGLRVGTLFSNRGTMSRLFADIGPNGILDNRFADITDSTFRLETGASLNNLGSIDDVSITTGTGSGGTVVNDGNITRLRSMWIGNSGDLLDNNGSLVNDGDIYNRGTIENGGSFDTRDGSVDNNGTFIAECDSTLLGTIDGNPPVIEPCDVTPPVVSVSGPLAFEAASASGATIAYAVSAIDDVDGPVAASCSPPNTAVRNLGSYSVSCSAVDATGNEGSLTFDVSIVDTTPPELTAPPDIEVEANGVLSAVDVGSATASDFYPVTLVNDAPAGGFPLGETTVTWPAADSSGNESVAVQIVRVVDTTAPELTVPPDVSTEATAVLTPVALGSAAASDLFDVTVTNDAPASGFPLGTTLVTWLASDASGNTTTATQSVTVVDTTPPELSLPDDLIAEANAVESGVDIGMATAADIFPVTVTSDAPATYPLGTTVVTWTAADSSGNATTGTQSVTIVDTTPPELSIPSDVTVVAAGLLTPVDIGTATATDIFPVTVTNDAPAGGYPIGVTEVTWRAEDANGNVTTDVQTIRAGYAFGGFESPLQAGKLYKLNRTLPVKFPLFFADGSAALTATATIQLQMLMAGELDGEPIDGSTNGSANEGNLFRISGERYIFNLSTKALQKGVYRIIVRIDDGSPPKTIDIGFK